MSGEEKDAAQVADELCATLRLWTSPGLKESPWRFRWGEQEERDRMEEAYEDDEAIAPTKRSKTFHRAGTPVMSNPRVEEEEEEPVGMDEEFPFNVASPWVARPHYEAPALLQASPQLLRLPSSSSSSSHRPYFQATERLWLFHKNATHRAEQEDTMPFAATAEDRQEVELDFLQALHRTCWAQSDLSDNVNNENFLLKEGNVWLLLATLRPLGVSAVWWDRSSELPAVLHAHRTRVLAQSAELTPAAVLRRFYDAAAAPWTLQRRQRLLHWLHQCFQHSLPPARPRRAKFLPNDEANVFCPTDQDATLLPACLARLLAGRLAEAQDLVRHSGCSWRAALWGGGTPQGYECADTLVQSREHSLLVPSTTTTQRSGDAITEFQSSSSPLVAVGNPRRALWRRMMWRHAEQLQEQGAPPHDVAMAALLSSHLKIALDSPALRTWECGFYAVLKCMMDRLEDELLHLHNEQRRQRPGPLFPGLEGAAAEREHWRATADVADLDEAEAVQILAGAPFDEMRPEDVWTQAMAAFVMGHEAIQSFMERMVRQAPDLSAEELRFVTHVAIYLDALLTTGIGAMPLLLEGAHTWKNELVLLYLETMVTQEDLWYMLVLYASLLPAQVILDRLPSLLQHIESSEKRAVIVQQMRDYLPEPNLELCVLRGIVTLVLSEAADPTPGAGTPTRQDIRKMESILWFSSSDENHHAGEALIAANTLLRQFFLAGHEKIPTAILFVEKVLNDLLTNIVMNAEEAMVDDGEEMPSLEDDLRIQNARSEHVAYLSFLEATKSVQSWKSILGAAQHTAPWSDASIDLTKLNSVERSIAEQNERRKVIDTKRTNSQRVVTAADAACKALRCILEHPGGWLLTDDEIVAADDIAGIVRRKELDQLHSQLLPLTAIMYYDVCVGTATWMSKSLDDAAEALDLPAHQAVQEIDDASSLSPNATAKSPIAPRFWTQKALQVADMIENDTYKVRSAFRVNDYKSLLSQLAETAILDSIYRYAER